MFSRLRPLTSYSHPLRRLLCSTRLQSASSIGPSFHKISDEANIKTIAGRVDLDLFREVAWVPQSPLLHQRLHNFPAVQKWFLSGGANGHISFTDYMKAYEDTVLSYEFTTSPGSGTQALPIFQAWLRESRAYGQSYLPTIIDAIIQSSNEAQESPNNASNFQQFSAPLSLIMSACQFNNTQAHPSQRVTHLYVAQSDINHLPEPLSQDVPVPDLVRHAGKGDIYSSSIWLGLQPTYTPLHRDPNPNLFCQLVGRKKIRLMKPSQGDDTYARIRRELKSHGNSRFRGTEMMGGRERELLHCAVWENEAVSEVFLNPGDALFIPTGWWHSVASSGDNGALNASVNWWFR